ncbi:MAG: Toprim domain protein [Candidatus Pacebacteria bacterium GW2011_GWF2_38_9]|nr:MAG: primase protein [candidate division TM6 bacterium GW2011_GWF2_28_16]KKQ10293.1 MAG: Toprim domain protein [Candidatus Pacebacteria bacterium GW2011_GWF1_36_5]KKQ88657.1 MAG: Toprim domain protein [Candidatus Pacebacteria bacterium GW2011_GWF2_38_9]HAZ73696.1 hypothetical protein [Candidatus Paceibacterota bacterium]
MLLENVADYLNQHNIEHRQFYGELITICPFCDKEKHFYIKAEDGCYLCHHCGEKGSWSQLTQKISGDKYIPLESKPQLYLPAPKPKLKLDDSRALTYHQQLPIRITEYLIGSQRGLTQDTIKQFQIGWDGSSITIPIFDQQGTLTNIKHRRDPAKDEGSKLWSEHGSTASLFNLRVLSQPTEFVVITEGEFDTMIATQYGFPAVSSTGGAGTFKPEWLQHFEHIAKIYICYDTDEAGEVGAKRTANLFGSKAHIVTLPSTDGKKVDLTDYFTKLEKSASDFTELLKLAVPLASSDAPLVANTSHGFVVKNNGGSNYEFQKDGLSYHVKLQRKKDTVVLALYKTGQLIHQDNINLHSDRRRSVFSSKLTDFNEDEQVMVAQSLMALSLAVDELNTLPSKTAPLPEKPLNQNEITEANILLDSPLLLHQVLNEVRKLGVIGEERNILLYYLALTSRITDNPLSVIVKGASAAGKSYVISKVLPLFPTDAYKDLTDATPQSFYYLEADALAHKVVLIFEMHGGQKADYSIRSLQSEGKLKIQTTVKNPETGEIETMEREIFGPTGFVTTTTRPNVHPENETRNFTVFPDETEKQTSRVLEVTNAKYNGTEIIKQPSPAFINLQKIIRPYAVLIPFAKELSDRFPKKPIRVRRDYSKLMSLIENVTLLHQSQREIRTINGGSAVVATLADYYVAQVLFEEILMRTIYEIHPKTEELLEKAKLIQANATNEDGQFTVRLLAKEIGWDDDTVRNWINPAVRKGFVEVVVESKGPKAAVYKLSDKPIEHTVVMPQVEELYEINSDWLNGTTIYHPITGKQLSLAQTTTDVPTLESLIEEI